MRLIMRLSICRNVLLTLCSFLSLAGSLSQARAACTPSSEGLVLVSSSPAVFTEYQPFTYTAQLCPVAQDIGIPIQFIIQGPSGIVFQQQLPSDANASATITVAAGLPRGGSYSLSVTAPSPTYDFSYFTYFQVDAPPITTLSGHYDFLLQGVSAVTSAPGAPARIGIAGGFLADGKGNINGEVDLNSTYGVLEHAPITGTYALNPAGRGTITLVTPIGPETFTLTAPTSQMYYQIRAAILTSEPGSAVAGSGSLVQRAYNYGYFPTQTPTFTTRFQGESACDADCLAANGQAQLLTGSGLLMLNYNSPLSYSLVFNQTAGPAALPQLTESGTLSTFDSYGRALLNQTSGGTGSPGRFAIYLIGYNTLYFLSLTPHDQANLMSGKLATSY